MFKGSVQRNHFAVIVHTVGPKQGCTDPIFGSGIGSDTVKYLRWGNGDSCFVPLQPWCFCFWRRLNRTQVSVFYQPLLDLWCRSASGVYGAAPSMSSCMFQRTLPRIPSWTDGGVPPQSPARGHTHFSDVLMWVSGGGSGCVLTACLVGCQFEEPPPLILLVPASLFPLSIFNRDILFFHLALCPFAILSAMFPLPPKFKSKNVFFTALNFFKGKTQYIDIINIRTSAEMKLEHREPVITITPPPQIHCTANPRLSAGHWVTACRMENSWYSW